MKSNDPDIMCTSLNDKIQPLLQTEQILTSAHAGINGTEINDIEMNTVQENILCTTNEEIAASLATNISCTDVSDDLATKLDESSSHKKQMSSLSEQDKHTKIGMLCYVWYHAFKLHNCIIICIHTIPYCYWPLLAHT